MIRNVVWLVGLLTWAVGCVLLLLSLALMTIGLPTFVVVLVCASVSPLLVAQLIGPVAAAYLASLDAGEVSGPCAGAVFGWRRFEARHIAKVRARKTRGLARLNRTVSREVLGGGTGSATLPGSLMSKDVYGQRYDAGTGLLVATDDCLLFVASTWFGRRCVVLGSTRGGAGRAAGLARLVTIGGDASLELRICAWRSATSLPSDEVWVRPHEPGVLHFVRQLDRADEI